MSELEQRAAGPADPAEPADRADPVDPADPVAPDERAEPAEKGERPPLYPTLLRLRHVHPNAWQRWLLGEGMAVLGALLVLADLASGWAIVVLPLAMAVVVKCHDVLAGLLRAEPDEAP